MIYQVKTKASSAPTITLLQMLYDDIPEEGFVAPNSTVTRKKENGRDMEYFNATHFILLLKAFNTRYENLREVPRQSLYNSFKIPKKSGGLRQIDAPCKELSESLKTLKAIFDEVIGTNFHHTCAFAYVQNRCTVDAVRAHQQNESKWVAKFDFSNFFGSTTLDFVMRMCKIIYPLNTVVECEEGERELRKAFELAFLNGGLPQGTPISPFITNMMMIPLDFEILGVCGRAEPHLIYTRYADDIIISCKSNFDYKAVESKLNEILGNFNAPFRIKPEKTHYCSSAGKNWILGVMLNKDNKITIGHENKKIFKSMMCHYITDTLAGKRWELDDVYHLQGLWSYYKSIEPEYIDYLVTQYNNKWRCDILGLIKAQIKGEL